ncbi:MAG TPA: AsnC family transcriptional regulator [Candidatus Acidoferrum sp.]|nr:AsnC family transcriptional regulator [Candidatus Acidoferrum sp.]
MSFHRATGVLVSVKPIDEIDAKILTDLFIDGRKNFQEIATDVGVSKNAISKHYEAMRKAKVILGSTTQINYQHLGYSAIAEICIIDYFKDIGKIQEELRKIPEILVSFFDPVKSTLYAIATLRQINDLRKLKGIMMDIAGSGRIRTYFWGGRILNTPEHLSSLQLLRKNEIKAFDEEKLPQVKSSEKENYDQIDIQIIDRLSINGRIPFKRIADEIGVTTDTVARRYRKLKSNGTIRVTIQIDPRKIGYQGTLDSIIHLKSQNNAGSAISALSRIPDVFCIVETHQGDADLHVWTLVKDINHLLMIQDQISQIPDFGKMDSKVTRAFMDIYPSSSQNTSIY